LHRHGARRFIPMKTFIMNAEAGHGEDMGLADARLQLVEGADFEGATPVSRSAKRSCMRYAGWAKQMVSWSSVLQCSVTSSKVLVPAFVTRSPACRERRRPPEGLHLRESG